MRPILFIACLLLASRSAEAQGPDNVLLVINEKSPASVEIGEYYAARRGLRPNHVLRLDTAATETIQRSDYNRTIDLPIGAWLTRESLQDEVLYIVLTKGIPLRIAGTSGRDGTVASVDSELSLLYRKLVGTATSTLGPSANPYFLGDKKIAEARRFTRFDQDIFLVTRLDGFSVTDVKRLIDRGLAPSADGKVVLDQKATLIDRGGDRWLQQTAERLRGPLPDDRIVLENTKATAASSGPVLGYFSWGSNDPSNQLRRFGLEFSPGAIGGMFVSSDGRTFAEPPAAWKPSSPGGGPVFGGSFQSLAGDLIRDGITGVAAHVDEPFLDATVRPQVLFPAYVAGFNLAESFYLAMPFLSWQTVVIGDPLCAPFPRTTLSANDIAKGRNAETGFPELFNERRLAKLGVGLNLAARNTMLKLEAEMARGETGNTEALLLRATELEPKFIEAHMKLASYYGSRNDRERSIERFRRVLAVDPDHVAALNDLAYLMAENGQAKDALPMALRALKLSQVPAILDTVGWIHHQLGEDSRGISYVEQALAGAPANVDILIHAALMHAALNNKARARVELDTALKIDPKAIDRAGVKALQDSLAPARQ